jgi:hypothetical protein
VLCVAAAICWIGWEARHQSSTVRFVRLLDGAPAAIFTPARWILAGYALGAVLMVLLTWMTARECWRGLRQYYADKRLNAALFVASLCCLFIYAGFASESARTRLVLTARSLDYQVGSRRARVARSSVLVMRLRRSHLEIDKPDGTVSLDLRPFSEVDYEVLVRKLPAWASLYLLPARDHSREEIVWVRQPQPVVR